VNLVKGFYNSPKGYALAGGLEAIRREAPKIGGSFAVWGGLFSAFDCTLVAIRRKEDPWNPIMSGALTGGVLQLRYGLASAGRSAAFGGFLLAVIEGISIMLTRVTAPQPPTPAMIDVPAATNAGPQISAGPQPTPTVVSADGLVSEGQVGLPEEAKPKGGFWGGIFGGGRKDDEDKTAAPAMPSFGGELK
jgi:import inner membrane translocase subunit TIM17